MTVHSFHPSIVREYDMRGVVGKTLTEADALALGKGFGTVVARAGGTSVVVGYDGRTHSPALEQALVDGLLSTGLRVIRIGLGPTPMVYFGVVHLKASAGIMVTGSHNPPDQNGFKMLIAKDLPNGGPFYGEAIKKLAQQVAIGDFLSAKTVGQIEVQDIRATYVARLLQDCGGMRPLKVVWDCGNGSGGEITQQVTAKLPGEHILLYADIDGRFPNHHPDPTVAANLVDLIKAVKEHKADFGVAFDGDADRIGAVDNMGRILAGDQLVAVYAAEVLRQHPASTIIADVKASQTLFDHIAALGGKPLMWKTGHSLIKAKMAETGAPLAGEMSGHIFFADRYYGYDDAIYAALRLCQMMAASDKALSVWRDELPATLATPELRLPVDDALKFSLIEKVAAKLRAAGADFSDIDGVRVRTPDGWWLIRASNTQAVIVARAEAGSAAGLERLLAILSATLADCGIVLPKDLDAASHH